ncbi:MAG: helix-turn-helix transcriptional regulator [Maribacter sp.]|uniref:helix-turn-helix domain-containing protein n=1 Tax=Maribacter sp. TaxID=1897614 RepID=UPI003C742FD3
MVNSTDFIKRLEIILRYYDLSAAVFADKINVQRSSISHLLSGRNKPSLEFVLKLVKTFPEVNLYWLLNGKGNFPATKETLPKETDPSPSTSSKGESLVPTASGPGKTIEHIVIFYSDGSFRSYNG